MKNTVTYLEDAKKALGITSDYAMAKWLGVTKQSLSMYKTGHRVIDDYAAAKIAEALGIDPLEVMATANLEREKDSKRQAFWRDLLGRSMAAGILIFAVFSAAYNRDAQAKESAYKSTDYTLCEVDVARCTRLGESPSRCGGIRARSAYII